MLDLREGPGTAYTATAKLQRGTVLSALGTTGDWLRVRTPRSLEGWINASYRGPIAALAAEGRGQVASQVALSAATS